MEEHPVRMTWRDAAEDLLEQCFQRAVEVLTLLRYEQCIKMKQKSRLDKG